MYDKLTISARTTELFVDSLLINVIAKGLVFFKHDMEEMSEKMTETIPEDLPIEKTNQAIQDSQKNIEKEMYKRIEDFVGPDKFRAVMKQAEKFYTNSLECNNCLEGRNQK